MPSSPPAYFLFGMELAAMNILSLFTSKNRRKRKFRSMLVEAFEARHMLASVPVALNDNNYSTNTGTDLVAGSGSLTSNDFDVDSLALSTSVLSGPSHGSLIAFGTIGSFTYRPTSGYSGPDSFTYIVSNGTYNSAPATVSIQVG